MKTKSLMVISRTPQSGMRFITMGIMAMLKRKIQHLAFFKPIVDSLKDDNDMHFYRDYFRLKQSRDSAYLLDFENVKRLLSQDRDDLIYEKILEHYEFLIKKYDFVICNGMINIEVDELIDVDINFEIAKNLQIPTVEIINAKDMSIDEIVESIDYIIHQSKKEKVRLLGLFINRVSEEILYNIRELKKEVNIFAIPEIKELTSPTMLDIIKELNGKGIILDSSMLDRTIYQSKVATMMLPNYLDYLEEGDLIIVSGDRCDILVGTLIANYSKNYPSIAGILLTGGITPPKSIYRLIDGIDIPRIPIISIKSHTIEAVEKVERVSAQITTYNRKKLALAEGIFSRYINLKSLKKYLSLNQPDSMSPIRFTYSIYEKAKESNSNILLLESGDERVLRATDIVLRRGLCKITLLGKKEQIYQKASTLGLDLSKATIIDPQDNPYIDDFIDKFYELRKDKGVIYPMAREMISRVNYFGTMMVYFGLVDGLVSGATHTTKETIKPAFQIIKTKKGIDIVSSIFFMLVNSRVLVYGDCAINPNPTAKELAQIAISSAQTAKTFGIEPIVAMLSYSSGNSGVGREVEKVREATKIAKELTPNLLIEGPIQYDTAIDIEVAKKKMPHSRVAGRATVFIFPDLNTGNNTYKAVQRSTNGVAIGPILQGLNRPFNDLSRGCSVDDIVHTIAITAIQAKFLKD